MIYLYLIINTFSKSKKVLLSFPLNEKHCNPGVLSINALTEIFLCEGKHKHIQDLIIGDFRYISYPMEIDPKKYLSGKMLVNDEEEENLKNIEKKKKILTLKMFNLVVVFSKHQPELFKKLNCLYKILESFSSALALEEYRSLFLGHEIMNIYSIIENVDSDSEENAQANLLKYQQLPEFMNNVLVRNLKQFYDDLNSWPYITKIVINNLLEFKFPLKARFNSFKSIKPYHSLMVYKKKNTLQLIHQALDFNPVVYLVINQSNSLKSLSELAMEFNLDIGYVSQIANQLHSWGVACIIRKLSHTTICTTHPELRYIPSKVEHCFELDYGTTIYSAIQKFFEREPIGEVFKKYFPNLLPEKFLIMIDFLLENQFLIQCRKYILPRFSFTTPKQKAFEYANQDHQASFCLREQQSSDISPEIILMNKSQIAFKKNNRYIEMLNEYDAYSQLLERSQIMKKYQSIPTDDQCGVTSIKEGSNPRKMTISPKRKLSKETHSNNQKKNISFSDILSHLKDSDVEILKNIRAFLSKDFDYEKILYYTGYNDEILTKFFNAHDYLFNVISLTELN